MANLTALCDVGHFWGQDVRLSPAGDLARVDNLDRSRERVLRRLMTNPGEYIWHPEYGAGLAQRVGTVLNLAEIRGVIRQQMLLEASVARSPEPTIKVSAIAGGVSVAITYIALPDRQPVPLAFDVKV